MIKPESIQNKAGVGGAEGKGNPAGAAAPISHPSSAICPRCGGVEAVAMAGDAPGRFTVQCPNCGTYTWDAIVGAVVEEPKG